MLPKSFALSDDEESLRSIPQDEWEEGHSDEGGPISLNEYSSIAIELPQLSWHGYCNCPDTLTLSNNGETVSITGKWKKCRPYVAGGPLNGSYLFSQIHFHWPSEHLLNERRYHLEMHAVHYKAAYLTEERAMKEDDGTVVLVYLFEVGNEKTSMSKLTSSLSRIKCKGTKTELSDSRLNDFMKPFVSNYFIYWGLANIGGSQYSLQWLISCSRLCISQIELCELKELFNSGEGEPPRKQMAISKPTSAGLFLVGGTVNAAFTEGNRSEVRFSDVEESLEAPENSKSCCFLTRYRKRMSSSRARDYSSQDGSLEKIYPKRSSSQTSVESTSSGRNDNKTSKCTGNTCQTPQQASFTDIRASSESPSTSSTWKSEQSCPCRSGSKSSDTTVNNCAPKGNNTDRCNLATTSKDEGKQNGKRKKKILKCLVRKNETHDCIGNGCENQVCSPECERNSSSSKQNDQGEDKGASKIKRKRRESSKVGSSSEEDVVSDDKPKEDQEEYATVPEADENVPESKETPVKEGRHKKGKAPKKRKSTERKEAQVQADTATEEVSKEMGQHNPIILAPATVGENQYIMKSVGTMTAHPPPPSYTRGTDMIGEGSDFPVQGSSISSSQIWRREKEDEAQIPEKADKSISASEHEEPEDLELLPTRRMFAEEGVQVEMGPSIPPANPVSDDEPSLSNVLAILAKDSSLGKVVADLSAEALPAEDSIATTIQSLTNLLNKISEDRQLVDLLRKVSGSGKPEVMDELPAKSSSDKTKTTENSEETSALPSVSSGSDKVSQKPSIQTESISEEKSMTADSPKSDKESGSDADTEKPSPVNDEPDSTTEELMLGTMEQSKHSFIINVLSEITKDPSLVAELVKTSKETPLAGVLAQALKDLTEEPKSEINSPNNASKEPSESRVSPASANATTQTLTRIVPHKVSKTFPGSSNIPTKANKEISESGTLVKAHKNRTLREPPEPGVSGNSSKKTSSGGNPTKASKNASGLTESTQSQNEPSLVAGEVESLKHLSDLKESANTQRRSVKASKETSNVGETAQVPKDTSSTCLLEKASKNSGVLSLDKGEISLASVLSRISKDPSLAKDLASIFRNKSVTPDTDPSFSGSDPISKSPSSKDSSLAPDISKQDASVPESKTQKPTEKSSNMLKKSSKENSGENVRTAPGEEAVVEVLKKVSTDHAVVADLAKVALVNILYAALKEPSSVPDLGNLLKKQSPVSVEENLSRKISTTKTSRQSLRKTLSRRESSVSRTLSSRSAQSLASDQRPIMEFSSSKEQLLIEILEKVCTAFPATAELVKSVTWVDILVTALKESSSPVPERSLDNQSLVTILGRLSRESSLTSNISRREVRDNYLENVKSGAAIPGKLKASSKSGVSTPSTDDEKSLREKVEIDVSEEVSMLNPNLNGETLIDVIVSALKEPVANRGKVPERKSSGSLPESPLSVSNKANISTNQVGAVANNSRNKLTTPSTNPNEVINPSKPLSTCDMTDCSEKETRVIPKKSSAADVLIEMLEKHPSAAEITMSLKNPFVIKLLERISNEPSLTDSTDNNESSTAKNYGRADDTKTTQNIPRKPSATDSECETLSEELELLSEMDSVAKRATTADTLKDPSIFMAISGNVKINADSAGRGQTADEPSGGNENVRESVTEKATSKSTFDEVSNASPQRCDQERNRANFETENNPNLIETERPEAEELHRQEDLNESIKSRRSTDTKRSGEEDAPTETKKTPEEHETAVKVATRPKTSASDKEAPDSVEKPDAVYLKARFLVKENATAESGRTSSENKASESEKNGLETKKTEEAETTEKKSMYFISEAIDVDPETGKKVLTGRFVTHNKCKTHELYY